MQEKQARNPWLWVPSVYFNQAVPYAVVMTLAVVMYKDLGLSNPEITHYTSLLYLPWVIKPLWSPVVDMFGTKRRWTVLLQLVVAVALGALAGALHAPNFIVLSLAALWIMAVASATHDIAADGYYMLALRQQHQAAFVGVRSTFYRIANLAVQGLLVMLAGYLGKTLGDLRQGWSVSFVVLAILFGVLAAWHQFILPRPAADHAVNSGSPFRGFVDTFIAFFKKRDIWLILGFLLTYRLGEAQMLKLVAPFLKDPVSSGGLGLSTEQYGAAYGTIGMIALTCGGLLGGWLISRRGLKRCLWLMVLGVHLPDLVFVYLSSVQPQSFVLISALIAVEQFGYAFGFTAMLLYMIMVSDGEHKTAHYALCTGFMALGMMVPGYVSGDIQQYLGYRNFFIWTCLSTIPAFIMAALVKIDPEFGKK